MKIVHVYPAEETGHVLDGSCPCGPGQRPVERDDGPPGWVVTHQSLSEPRCPHCLDEGHVCEDHPDKPWEGLHGTVEGHAEHGGIGMPCPACCPPVPQDGRHSIAEAFTPERMRR